MYASRKPTPKKKHSNICEWSMWNWFSRRMWNNRLKTIQLILIQSEFYRKTIRECTMIQPISKRIIHVCSEFSWSTIRMGHIKWNSPLMNCNRIKHFARKFPKSFSVRGDLHSNASNLVVCILMLILRHCILQREKRQMRNFSGLILSEVLWNRWLAEQRNRKWNFAEFGSHA